MTTRKTLALKPEAASIKAPALTTRRHSCGGQKS
jgi:hypothetical protein